MLSADSFDHGAVSLWRRRLGLIIFLVFLSGCSFHSTQLSFIQGLWEEFNAEEGAVNYWVLTLPDVSLKAVPIIQSDRLFFSDGEKYLVSVGTESIAEIRALDTGTVEKFAVTSANEAERLIAKALPGEEPVQNMSISESSEDGLAIDGGLIVRSKTRLPDTIYFCSSWVYRLDNESLSKLCETRGGGKLKFTHALDDRGVVKRFNVMLDDQLVIDLERTGEVIRY
jgi:hypothetical protein